MFPSFPQLVEQLEHSMDFSDPKFSFKDFHFTGESAAACKLCPCRSYDFIFKNILIIISWKGKVPYRESIYKAVRLYLYTRRSYSSITNKILYTRVEIHAFPVKIKGEVQSVRVLERERELTTV